MDKRVCVGCGVDQFVNAEMPDRRPACWVCACKARGIPYELAYDERGNPKDC